MMHGYPITLFSQFGVPHHWIDNDEFIGIPDYLSSKRSELGKIIFDFPLLAVVEAKKDGFASD